MSGTKQTPGDSRGVPGLHAGPQTPSSSHPLGAAAACPYSSTTLDLQFLPKNLPFGASRANRNPKGPCDTEEWPTDAQQELQHQIASSFDISAKVFIQPLSSISTKLSILAARVKIFTYNLSTSDTNKHVYFKCSYMLKANIILLAKKLLNWQEVIRAKEVCSKSRGISFNYFLPTHCTESASSFQALHPLAALLPTSSR